MESKAFDTSRIDEYARQAKAQWGTTDAYKEFEEKSKNRTMNEEKNLGEQLMAIIAEFGTLKESCGGDAAAEAVQAQVKKVQNFITEHYYSCTDEVLAGLGQMYGGGGDFTMNINEVGGEGAAEFAAEAIEVYCNK